MAEFNTPLPSVFMTPTSSCGRPVFHPPKALLTPPSFSLPSPAHTPPPSPREHKDILNELFEAGVLLVAMKVLSFLDKEDISRCLRVTKSWNRHITKWNPLPPKPLALLADPFSDENSVTSLGSKSQLLRAPLAVRVNNGTRVRHKSPKKQEKETAIKMRPCPQCQSPAKKLNIRRAECTKCHFDFCQYCFRTWHEESCADKNTLSSPKKSQEFASVAGSKKSKKRLRRL